LAIYNPLSCKFHECYLTNFWSGSNYVTTYTDDLIVLWRIHWPP